MDSISNSSYYAASPNNRKQSTDSLGIGDLIISAARRIIESDPLELSYTNVCAEIIDGLIGLLGHPAVQSLNETAAGFWKQSIAKVLVSFSRLARMVENLELDAKSFRRWIQPAPQQQQQQQQQQDYGKDKNSDFDFPSDQVKESSAKPLWASLVLPTTPSTSESLRPMASSSQELSSTPTTTSGFAFASLSLDQSVNVVLEWDLLGIIRFVSANSLQIFGYVCILLNCTWDSK